MSHPLNMNSMPASGYNHKSTIYNNMYVPWKGTGVNSNPVGTATGHIRPLTNNDPGNVFQTGFGLPRPIKHFRKGRVIPSAPVQNVPGTTPDGHVIDENALINYNLNRFVKSSNGSSLGGGAGGSGLLNDMMDKPAAVTIHLNPITETGGVEQMDKNCTTCEGVGVVADYYPNKTFLQENPEPNTENPVLCCNAEVKAKKRAIYASTNLKKNYYTTTKQYLQNRCKTYDQKAFNFRAIATNQPSTAYGENNQYWYTTDGNKGAEPGSPLAETNTYLANCQMNSQLYIAQTNANIAQMLTIMQKQNILTQAEVTAFYATGINSILGFFNWLKALPPAQSDAALKVFKVYINNPNIEFNPSHPSACQLTVYNPNNYQFAQQGAVDSSTRNLKLMVDVISTNAASMQRNNNTGPFLVNANELYQGNTQLTKQKGSACNSPWPLNMSQSGRFENKKFCHYKELPRYQIPAVQPLTYKYYPTGNIFSSNHFSQSPNTYNTTSGSRAY